ncbi:MAG: SET domain-containing protein-lysine N-methyltransferase [Candidatus Chromulinivorax sp.]
MKFKNYIILLSILFFGMIFYFFYNNVVYKPVQQHHLKRYENVGHEILEVFPVKKCDKFGNCKEVFDYESQIVAAFQDLDKNNNVQISIDENLQVPQFTSFEQKIFITQQDYEKLFKLLGIEYIRDITCDHKEILAIDARSCDRYKNDKKQVEFFSSLCADKIKNKCFAPISIRWISKSVGYGVFAEEDIAKDDFIGFNTGVLELRSSIANRDYAWGYPVGTVNNNQIFLNALHKGNELRFINDSRQPNCFIRYILGQDNIWYPCYFAKKDIKKGEQILTYYGPSYWKTRQYPYQELH